ncbi:hypothetical protein [Staphylococcus pseudintermedius]|uniref:hypothetical protein n=1 Tax=Staphylococcus pseudintermedius TaxID=283734 RepID=UPI003F673299
MKNVLLMVLLAYFLLSTLDFHLAIAAYFYCVLTLLGIEELKNMEVFKYGK